MTDVWENEGGPAEPGFYELHDLTYPPGFMGCQVFQTRAALRDYLIEHPLSLFYRVYFVPRRSGYERRLAVSDILEEE